MKKFFSKFLKDTRGVVMMEYIILGCFAVAVTLVAVLALGKAYNNGLATMAWATYGSSKLAVEVQKQGETQLAADLASASNYGKELTQTAVTYQPPVTYDVYVATTTP